MHLSTQSLTRASSRRPWLTVGIWVVTIAASIVVDRAFLGDALTEEANFTNNPESKQALELVEERLRGPRRATEIVIVSSSSTTVDDPAFRSFVERLQAQLKALGPGVVQSVHSYYDSSDPTLVSKDRRTTILPTILAGELADASHHAGKLRALAESGPNSGFTVQLFGPASLNDDFNKVLKEDLAKGESFGIMAALAVLVVVFGAVVAAVLPILLGLAAIALAIGLVALVGQVWEFSFFVQNMVIMMGLAVGIDYSLFVVSRYREERARGLNKLEAIEASGATATRAVFFSGMTVVLALVGMLLIPTTIYRSLAGGAIFVVVLAVVATMTLLPAILALLGDRINRLRVRRSSAAGAGVGREGGFWDKVSHGVMRRPITSLVAGLGILLLAASSALDMKTGFSGVSTLPDSFEAKKAFQVLAREFAGGLSSPVEIVVDGPIDDPAVQSGMERLQASLASDGQFGPTQVQVNPARDLALIAAPLNGDPASKAAADSIDRIRDRHVPAAFGGTSPARARVLVGGETAFNKDFFDLTDRYLPIVFAFVLGLSFVLLTVAFRSIVVPLKAIVLNMVSVGAAYGLLVLVFIKGVGNEIFGFQQVEVIQAWLPLFLFSVLFGLSMDYHVFLLSRIREHYDHTHDNALSVAYGLRTTAGIITGAALIMVAVFAGFASGEMVMFEQMGFGLGVAVLIDATLIRTILVPSSMKLLGQRNWYLPRWLEWLPKVTMESPHVRTPEEKVADPVPVGPGAAA